MKISIILTVLALLFAININTVTALTQIQTGNKYGLPIRAATESGINKLEERKEKVATTTIERLKQKASNEITRRITSLTNVNNKISEIKRFTESQKSSLINDIQSEISNLTKLNKKIQLETDLETLRTDVKSIISSHRTYLLFLPKTQIIIAANAILNSVDKLNELSTKLQTRINEAKNKGEDTTSMETTLTDMQTKITDAKTQANNAINAVSALKPTDYPGNKTELQSARTMLQTAHKDLITAKQDAQKIIVELRKMNKNNSTVSPTDITGPNQVDLNVDSIIKNVTSTKNDLTAKSILKVKSINLKGKIIEWCISNSAMWMDGYFKDSSGEIPVIFKGVNVHHCKDNNYKTDIIEYESTIEAAVMHKEMTDNIGTSVGIVTFLEVNKIIEQ